MRRNQEKGQHRTLQALKQRLIFLISLLGAMILVLLFRVGQGLWPAWIAERRLQILGIVALVLLFLILLSPLIIESSKRPRDFPGPGKNPYIDP